MDLYDAEPWNERERDTLNPSSHAAHEAFAIVGMAIEVLERAERTITPRAVQAMSGTLLHIVNAAQAHLLAEGRTDLQSFSHARVREALAVALAEPSMPPPPFYTTAEDFEAWVSRMTKRVNSISATAVWLWSQGPGDKPWLMLFDDAHDPHPAAGG